MAPNPKWGVLQEGAPYIRHSPLKSNAVDLKGWGSALRLVDRDATDKKIGFILIGKIRGPPRHWRSIFALGVVRFLQVRVATTRSGRRENL
jgi:hypothetical protein